MGEWTWQAQFGLIGGGILFWVVLVPLLVLQVRRYGGLSFRRLLGAAAVSVYAVALVAYTLLPLPEMRANCGVSAAGIELVPGHSIGDILRETEGLSITGTLTSRATMQVVLNVMLFVPLGVIARRYWNRGPVVSILLGAAVSLGIELTQLTGVWGLYACAYRVADVDDLLANTAGAAIGVALAPLLLAWMPSSDALRAERRQPRPVTVWRRWFGMILDAIIVQVAISTVSVFLFVPRVLLAPDREVGPGEALIETAVIGCCAVVLVVVVPALVSSGASLGQRILWLEPRWSGRRGSSGRRLARASVVALPYTVATVLQQLPEGVPTVATTVTNVVGLLSTLVLIAAVASVPFSRGRRGLSFAISGAELHDARA